MRRGSPILMLVLSAIAILAIAVAGCGSPTSEAGSASAAFVADDPATPATAPPETTPDEPTEAAPNPPPPGDPADSGEPEPVEAGIGLAVDADVYPLRVRIGGIDVDAPIIDLGLNDDGTLEVPKDFDLTGWYTGRSVPGELGPGVVVGHVDSTDGPAVFYRLRNLDVGDVIEIDRSDGLVAMFAVRDVVLVEKDEFPTEQVYGATEEPTLRLITCGGSFDRGEGSYNGNLIVYADHLGNFQSAMLVNAAT